MRTLIKSAKLVYGDNKGIKDILIEDHKILQIHTQILAEADEIIDAKGLVAIPGLIDLHTHLREPGQGEKETIATGTAAAAKGGYTSICCMPNTKPVIDSVEHLKLLTEKIEAEALIHVYPIGAITYGLESKERTNLLELKEHGCIAFSDDGRVVASALDIREALKIAKEYDLLLIEHCEENSLVEGGVINEGVKSKELGLKGMPASAEEIIVIRDILLAMELDTRIHIAHISTKGTVDLIRWAKTMGSKVTCEVMPHHIALTEDCITPGYTDCKVNPPIRTKKDVEAIIEGIKDGTIDIIATDHAPHRACDKTEDFSTSAFGISNIEHCFSICYTELVHKGILTIENLIEKMAIQPGKIIGIPVNTLSPGDFADFFLVDLEKEITIRKEEMLSKGKNTPFHGMQCFGEIKHTFCKGKIVHKGE